MRNDSNYPFSYTDLTDTFCIGNVDDNYNIFYVKHHSSDNGNVVINEKISQCYYLW